MWTPIIRPSKLLMSYKRGTPWSLAQSGRFEGNFLRTWQARKLGQDEVSFRRRRNVVVLKWKDKREVCVHSTIHNPTEKVLTTTWHATRAKSIAVRDYSKYMSGCDHSDQFHAYVPLRCRSLKWWKKTLYPPLCAQPRESTHPLQQDPERKRKTKVLPPFLYQSTWPGVV